jgi:hypothetical protein
MVGWEIKQRRKKISTPKELPPSKKGKPAETKKETISEHDKSPVQIFLEHPLIVVLPWFILLYLLYLGTFYYQLKRPDLLLPLGIHLRPAVDIHEPRQVLILGSMSSGTLQVQHELTKHLRLEIGHESSNTHSEFVRDGTISWIQVMRYLEPPTTKEAQMTAMTNLCASFTPSMGFHPAMYGPSKLKCSQRNTWDPCWSKECSKIVQQEWGCALKTTSHQCITPFAKVLHQVRHPLRTIESLVAKFCQGNNLEGTVHPSFVKFLEALFPPLPGHDYNYTDDSCVEAAAHYVLAFHQAIMSAQLEFLVDGIFAVETSTPCDIARLAGLLGNSSEAGVVYPPNAVRITRICSDTTSHANSVMKSDKHKINKGLVSLTWEDLHGGKHGSKRSPGDASLEKEVRGLAQQLGYNE